MGTTPDKKPELTKAEIKAAKKIEDERKSQAFKQVLKYPKKEWCWITSGMVCLVIGTVGDTVMPFVIGVVIDDLAADN